MPGIRTEITEIVTGLGMLGAEDLADALDARPAAMRNVEAGHWQRLAAAYADGEHAGDFAAAWENGRRFLAAVDGLRGRLPVSVEWKGPHQQPGYDALPADLRVDHVYLVSCKYRSRILANSSPTNLFLRRLADRTARPEATSWFAAVAADEYRHFYECVRARVGRALLPTRHEDLTPEQIGRIRDECGGVWPNPLVPIWQEFSFAVAQASANHWREQLATTARKEEMLWRLLRLGPAPYFVLGSSPAGPMRLRIGTPWDWRQNFALLEFSVEAVPAGQPTVAWKGVVADIAGAVERQIVGHVEVRWAHGRFSSVEAKIYLDTPHADVPGYFPLG